MMETLCPAHTATRRPPVNLTDADHVLFEREFSKPIRATTLLRVRNARIIGDMVYDPAALRFRTGHTHAHSPTWRRKLRRGLGLLRPAVHIARAAWIHDEWSHGYFHWMTDALPRAMALGTGLNDVPVLIPKPWEGIPFIRRSLELLGIAIHVFGPARPLRVNELLLPSHTASTGNYNRRLVQELRLRLAPTGLLAAHRRVHITRAMAAKRHIANEEELVPILREMGFEIHAFEHLTLDQQIQLMQETRILSGLHGAGLTNMLFMRPGCCVLEVRNRTDGHNNCYFSLASELDHDYFHLPADPDQADTHTMQVHVDPVRFKETLTMLCHHSAMMG